MATVYLHAVSPQQMLDDMSVSDVNVEYSIQSNDMPIPHMPIYYSMLAYDRYTCKDNAI